MTVRQAHMKLSVLLANGHGDVNLYTDYVEEGGIVNSIHLTNTDEHDYDCGELCMVLKGTPVVLISSHH